MIQVYLVKRYRKRRKRNGQRDWLYALRWKDGTGWKYESTGTADKTTAEAMLVAKRDELNAPPESVRTPSQEAEGVKAPWQDCRDALERAMKADNLRPSYVSDSLRTFDVFRRMFPGIKTPADVTPEHANEYKRRRAEANISPWSRKGDLATLKAAFGKWLGRECGLLTSNPFANVKPPKCDDPDVRIVSAAETEALFNWLSERWNRWCLPLVYLKSPRRRLFFLASMLCVWHPCSVVDLLVAKPTRRTPPAPQGWSRGPAARRQECVDEGWTPTVFRGLIRDQETYLDKQCCPLPQVHAALLI